MALHCRAVIVQPLDAAAGGEGLLFAVVMLMTSVYGGLCQIEAESGRLDLLTAPP